MSSPLDDYITEPLIKMPREAQEAAFGLAVAYSSYHVARKAEPWTDETRNTMIRNGRRLMELQEMFGVRLADPENVRRLIAIAEAELAGSAGK